MVEPETLPKYPWKGHHALCTVHTSSVILLDYSRQLHVSLLFRSSCRASRLYTSLDWTRLNCTPLPLQARKALALLSTRVPMLAGSSSEAAAEAMARWRVLDRVAVQNCVALNVLNSGLASGNELVVTLDFIHHPQFPVMVVKGKK